MATTTATQVQQLYVGLLGRAADQGGLNWWVDQITTGGRTLEDIRASFVTSTEYTNLYGGANTTRADLVTAIYQNLFERTPSAGELNYWVSTDTRPADQLVSAFLQFASAADQTVINNKTFVAQTYTDTAGAGFNATAAASVIANVDGSAASVTTALTTITNGSLPGQVAGLGLINAKVAADKAVADFGKTVAAANPSYDTNKDGSVSYIELTDAATGVIKSLNDERTAIGGPTASLKGDVTTASEELLTAKAAVTKVAATANATAALDAAVAAQATTAQKTANTAALNAAKAGIDTTYATAATGTVEQKAIWKALDDKLTTDTVISDAASLLSAINNPVLTAADRAILVAEVKAQLGAYGNDLVVAADQKVAYDKADAAVTTATTNLNNALVTSGAAADTTAAGVLSKAYTDAVDAKKTAVDTLAKAEAADKAIAAAEAVKTQYEVVNKIASDADTALTTAAGVGGALAGQIVDLNGKTANQVATAKADTFYFSAKDSAFDHAITGFAAGDAIVLGSNYTFNSGAVSTGDNNKLEFFFVKTATGTNVVVESIASGSASASVDASTGGVTTVTGQTDNVAVIELTGVSIDHLSANNGVISYV